MACSGPAISRRSQGNATVADGAGDPPMDGRGWGLRCCAPRGRLNPASSPEQDEADSKTASPWKVGARLPNYCFQRFLGLDIFYVFLVYLFLSIGACQESLVISGVVGARFFLTLAFSSLTLSCLTSRSFK